MEKKSSRLPVRDRSRPDRSRSPHRGVRPWENGREPKSVLYPADVQFHRQNSSKANNSRSPVKPSTSPSKHRPATKFTRTSPLKEQPQARCTRTISLPHQPDRSARKLVERMRKWNEMNCPSKFVPGFMPLRDESKVSKPHQTTPKSRKHETWTIDYFTKEPFVFDRVEISTDKSHPFKENIRVIERPRQRTCSSPTFEDWERVQHGSRDHYAVPNPSSPSMNCGNVVQFHADAHTTSKRKDAVTPSHNDGQLNQTTPGNLVSPDDVFYTPMTHIRPSQREQSSDSNAYRSLNTLQFTPPVSRPQFSLIAGKESVSAVHSPFDRTDSFRKKTEAQLAAIDKVSSKIDIAIKQARDVLSKPIRLGLPLFDSSSFPSFSENRQTIDPSQLENFKRMSKDSEMSPPRRSLPAGFHHSKYGNTSNIGTDSALDRSMEKMSNRSSNAPIDHDVSYFLSMEAELAYAERVEKTHSHLNATRCLARKAGDKIKTAQQNEYADIDAILDSIVLQDRSLMSSESREAPSDLQPSANFEAKIKEPSPVKPQISEQEERTAHIDSYIRMRKKLHKLQVKVLQLEKRSAPFSAQSRNIEQLIETVNEEHERDVEDAELLLTQKLATSEFLLLIKHRQRKVYDATERWCDTMKRLLHLDVPEQPRKSAVVPANKENAMRSDHEAVRVETKVLIDKAVDGAEDLSARTMRRNLEARREQAEKLNRSFEERSRDIEQMTKKSIAVQLHKYDRVIAERTNLISHLEKISTEECYEVPILPPRTPTPHRDGVAPLDLSQLSEDDPVNEMETPHENDGTHSAADNQQTHFEEEQTAISRTQSQSTVYEDSLSHFDDEDDRPASVSSEATLYQSDFEDQGPTTTDAKKTDDHRIPSRRTLDTAETLTMLSRNIVVVASTSESDDVHQKIESIINEAVRKNATSQEADLSVRLEKVETIEEVATALVVPTDGRLAVEANVSLESIGVAGRGDRSSKDTASSKLEEHKLVDKTSDDKALAGGDVQTVPPVHAIPDRFPSAVAVGDTSQPNENPILQPSNPEKVSVVVRPPKDFSRLRLFFGSPDEPTEDSVDQQPTDDDDIPNDQFVTRREPSSDMLADDTDDSDRVPETASVNGDEDVPVITLRRFVYKEPAIGEKYQ
ncbi:hypothetical protein COOONC_04517, partial [Cooperia oncophora]